MESSTEISVDIFPGSTSLLRSIPGTQIHNIELYPGSRGHLVRPAGTYACTTKSLSDRVAISLTDRTILTQNDISVAFEATSDYTIDNLANRMRYGLPKLKREQRAWNIPVEIPQNR